MKRIFTLVLFSLIIHSTKAQKFLSTTFDKLPQSYQLYPRDANSEAFLPISGKIEEQNYDYFSVQILRNKQIVGYQKAIVSYSGSVGKFAFSPIKIKAEKAEYDFKIYSVKGKDSTNLVNRENIVSGDVYVMSGQSNSTGFFQESAKNEFCRTFGKISGTLGTENYNPADTLWALSNQDSYAQGVGAMGFEFQRIILEKYGIPTCLINGGFHFSSMQQHATRTVNNPADLTNGYGRMLYRIQKAGVANAVKALIYRQGETEAYGEGSSWTDNFDVYYKNVKTDFPNLKQLYIFQIDVIGFTKIQAGSSVRDSQRKKSDKYTDVQVVASLGTVGFDGLHYTTEGYRQNAQEFTRLIERDFYGSTDVDNIDAPNIRKAYFSTKDRREITLTFDKGQELSWTNQYRSQLMKDQFFLDGDGAFVSSGSALGNKVILKFNDPVNRFSLSYLPPYSSSESPDFPYNGPFIRNKRGLRALSFHEVKVEPFSDNLAVPAMSFSKIPQDLQLFPQNAKNEAMVSISGNVETIGYNALALLVLRNNLVVKYYKSTLNYAANKAEFSFLHTIKAELANYNFKLYAIKGADSVLVTSRDNVVAGDVYLINGQSNAVAWNLSNTFPNSTYRNDFCRTFGQVKGNSNFISVGDTTWAYANAGKPYVGVWGIELQKNIVEKYGIPTCFLNESTLTSTIAEQSSRDVSNPVNVNNIYGRLLYRAKKAGLIDNIKGYFYWQGESEAVSNPLVWKAEFEKLYNSWKIDYPSINKFYVFQVNILGQAQNDAGELRDFQRQIKKNYPKTEVFSTAGILGYNGLNYSVEGYQKIANNAFRVVSRDFYGSTDSVQISSPNVQKAYYSTSAKDEITILFEESQKMIWTADSTYNQDNGTPRKYFMKDYIYLNNTSDKVLSGRAENNKIVLKTSGFTSNQTLTYLPSYYPLSYSTELRSIFGGPFLKNQRGITAFSFNKQTILDPISPPTLTAKLQTATSLQLSWKEVTGATSYVLEIKDLQSEKYSIIKVFPKGNLTFLVENLLGNSTYTLRIKTIAGDIDSEYSSIQIQTPKTLETPKLSGEATYYDEIKLTWQAVPEAVSYLVERKNSTTNAFETIAKLEANKLDFLDKSLINNTLYTYRIKAIGTFTESIFAVLDVKTLAYLQTPAIALSVINFNSIKLDWKPIANTTSYLLERKAPSQDFKVWGLFEPSVLSFTDKDLLSNTSYTYRIKALSDKTESLFGTIIGKTTTQLNTPEMNIVPVSFDQLKISWKPVLNVKYYILDRKLLETDAYQNPIRLDSSKTEFIDVSLKENTNYFYRLKAFGDKTESEFVEQKTKTSAILQTQEEIDGGISLYPNPTHTQVTIHFLQPTTGQVTIVDIKGVTYFQEQIYKKMELIVPLSNYQSGVYVVIMRIGEQISTHKLLVE